jgi:uncharacterized delta-60 repeat protein
MSRIRKSARLRDRLRSLFQVANQHGVRGQRRAPRSQNWPGQQLENRLMLTASADPDVAGITNWPDVAADKRGDVTITTNTVVSQSSMVTHDQRLTVDGVLHSPLLLLVKGSELKGHGIIDGAVTATAGATVAPGNSPGILNTGDFTLAAGSALDVELSGFDSNPGVDYDQVNVTGTVTLAGTLNTVPYSTILTGQEYVIIRNDGSDAVTGTFAGLAEGATFTIGTLTLQVTYAGGDGNDVILKSLYNTWTVTDTSDAFAGSPDASFNAGGIVTTAVGSGTDIAHSSVLDSTGRLIVAGYSFNGSSNDFVVTRYNTNGTLDTSFGTGGNVTTDFGSDDRGYGVAVDSLGRIVVVGSTGVGINMDFAAARYLSNGTLDSSFDGDGKVITGVGLYPNPFNDAAYSVLIDGSDRIIAGGYTETGFHWDFALVRYNVNGSLDTSFGGDGRVNADIAGNRSETISSLAWGASGKIVAAGHTLNPANGGNWDIALARFNDDGSLDTSLAGDGTLATTLSANNADLAKDVVVDSLGRIVLAGYMSPDGTDVDLAVVRYLPDGTLDTTFDGDGVATTSVASGHAVGNGLAIDSQGRLVLAGYSRNGTNREFLTARYLSNGSLDTAFGNDGIASTDVDAGESFGQDVLLDGNGAIIVAGYSNNGSNEDLAAIRLDAAGGSLRQSLREAKATPGPDRIEFNIPGAGPHTIQPLSALPAITDSVIVDGWSEPDFAGMPIIELDGSKSGAGVHGLRVTGSNSTIRGLVVNRFGGQGIQIDGSVATGNVISGSYIGTDITGTIAEGNAAGGIEIKVAAWGNVIGGTDPGTRNVISGNAGTGISIVLDSHSNVVEGNYIGTDVTGAGALPNIGVGVQIAGSANNRIGGSTLAERNIVSGNGATGIHLGGVATTGNVISGNYVGTDATGTRDLGNAVHGVSIVNAASLNVVGGSAAGAGNTVSGNGSVGILISGASTNRNVAAGNFIGTDASGTTALGNAVRGVQIDTGASDNLIGTNGDGVGDAFERNVISGNSNIGVWVTGAGSDNNVIAGNFIGTDVSGTLELGNTSHGIQISGAASDNLVGTNGDGVNDVAERNVISGNGGHGVFVASAGSDRNVIAGNFIGTDVSGTLDVGNTIHGVSIVGGASSTTVGGNSAETGNIISGNDIVGILISGAGTRLNVVAGNHIGTNVNGTSALENVLRGVQIENGASDNLIGTNSDGVGDVFERNIISGNSNIGILIAGAGSDNNVIAGNFIGTDVSGTLDLGNATHGIQISGGASDNLVGTNGDGVNDTAERNVISGNSAIGVYVASAGSDRNIVAGNYVGVDVSGTLDLGNTSVGILVQSGPDETRVGTDGSNDAFNDSERNVVSGNDGWAAVAVSGNGTDRTVIAGNYVGLNAAGDSAIANSAHSVAVVGGSDTRIGTDGNGVSDAAERNVISGNLNSVLVERVGTVRTIIAGNFIGTNAAGDAAIPNPNGIIVRFGATDTRIGTDGSNDAFNTNERNVISGNSFNGVVVNTVNWNGQMPAGGAKTDGTVIAGNYIGLDAAGTAALPNAVGIVAAQHVGSVRIGTDGDGIADNLERNIISGNTWNGVQVDGWTLMNLLTVDQFISGDITTTTATSVINQLDLFDTTNGAAGNWTFDNAIPGDGGDFYGIQATGTIQVNAAGDYTFAVGSDNGSRLRVDGNDVVVYDVGWQGFGDRFGTVTLSAGAHTFELIGYEQNGAAGFEVSVAVGNGVAGPVTEANGWRVLGATNPHTEIALSGTVAATAYYPGPEPTNVTIAGNYIGTDPTGAIDLGNNGDGVRIEYRATGVTVGGTTPLLRNVISGNNQNGVHLFSPGTSGNTVLGNYLGTDASGTAGIGNTNQGLRITSASNNLVGGSTAGAGNVIADNRSTGLAILGVDSTGNRLEGNFIGVTPDGTTALANRGEAGVLLIDAVSNTIGGSTSGTQNVISGNAGSGVWIRGALASGNAIEGNIIGLAADGTTPVGNAIGVRLESASHTVGGTVTGSRNIISGNSTYGVYVSGSTATGNAILGNYIGTDLTGTLDRGNASYGVFLTAAATNNSIGQSTPGAANVISGNNAAGVYVDGNGTTGNTVAGNLVGTDAAGNNAIGNSYGVEIVAGASGNVIGGSTNGAGNVISGSGADGVRISGDGTDNNIVAGNLIGLNAAGTLAIGNNREGIVIEAGASDNLIGTDGNGIDDANERNVISASGRNGVFVQNPGTDNNVIAGNYIGLNAAGDAALGNLGSGGGVYVRSGPTGTIIGGTATNTGNVISGNNGTFSDGIEIESAGGTMIYGNILGLDATGTFGLGNRKDGILLDNAFNTVVGGSTPGHRNVMAGNGISGIAIIRTAGTNNVVQGNYIGTGITGMTAVPNSGPGVYILLGAHANVIGTDGDGLNDANEGNVISGNAQSGVWIRHAGSDNNVVAGNLIGTDATGTQVIGNQPNGVHVFESASDTLIGGTAPYAGNVISGNDSAGVSVSAGVGNAIVGNFIGTDVSGSLALGNSIGVEIRDGSSGTVIGGAAAGSGNVISGNRGAGIFLGVGGASGTAVQGNLIGTDATGSVVVSNTGAGVVLAGATGTTIGGSTGTDGNVIAGNLGGGVLITDAGSITNVITGNRIGTNLTGGLAMGNAGFGISVADTSATTIGGTATGSSNVIAFNQGPGLWLTDAAAAGSTVLQNSFYSNQGLAVDLGTAGPTLNDPGDADGFLNVPIITAATVDSGQLTLEGFLGAGGSLELYLNAPAEGQTIGQGSNWLVTLTEGSAADLDNNTDTYGPDVDGVTVSTGPVTANRFQFVIPLPAGVDNGTQLTAVALGSVSEFSPVVLAGEQASALAPEITLNTTSATISAGGSLEVAGTFYDPDSTTWTATVDYGDGAGSQPLSLSQTNTFNLSHAYTDSGSYSATVRITDNSLATGVATVAIVVENEAPAVTFSEFSITSPAVEGQLVTLVGEFLDAGGDHSVRVEWGDGGVSDVTVPSGGRQFTAQHTYLDDTNLAGSATAADVYRVVVTVTDDGGANDSTPLGLFLEEVNNVRPSDMVINFNSTSLIEGDELQLSGLFSDPGVLDVHTARVNWGDGSESLIVLPVGDRAFGGLPTLRHVYPNDRPTGADSYVVTVELWDDDEPLQPERFIQTIIVDNQIPQNVTATVTPGTINENDAISLSGSFTDAGVQDAHLVRVVWGDGSPDAVFQLAAGVTSFSGIPHTYLDNNAGNSSYPIQLFVSDYDSPATSGVGTTSINVANIAPVLGTVTLSSAGTAILEGDSVTVTGSYSDVGTLDRHTVNVSWGDGTASPAIVDSASGTFLAEHQYVDNPPAGLQFTITVTVSDDDGDTDDAVLFQSVLNVAPIIFVEPAEDNFDPNLITMNAVVIDPGTLDAVAFAWTAFPLVTNPPASQTGTGQSFTVDRTGFTGALWRIQLNATDGDGGVTAFETTLLAGTNGDDSLTIDPSTVTAAGTTDLLILGMGGDDVIDASAITDPTVSLSIDGGEGLDFLYGGEGDDTFYLQKGDDSANLDATSNLKLPAAQRKTVPLGAPAAARRAGRDRYVLTPNSTLTIADDLGANILDFSRADFGDGSGVQYDLSLVGTTDFDLQDVYAGTTGTQQNTHFVQALGTFSVVTGSTYDDVLTGASGATVDGGAGSDQFMVKTGTTGATFVGGADDDVLTVTGSGIADLSFGGDDGVDTLVNSGTITGLTFGGGADDDVLQNLAGGTVGDLNFGGDDGVDTLINTGDITTLTFGGGADDDVLTNQTGGTITTLNFGGDDGVDTLQNTGTIATLTFGGGADDDVLTNTGSVTNLDFTGGADDDVLTNTGTIITTLTFGGDDGVDTLQNTGTIAGLTFTGGADDDVLLNQTNGDIATLNFGGDDGVDTLQNTGTIGSLTFGGGADDDVLVNLTDGTVTTLNFGGDDGVDVLQNDGNVGSLTFNGGADDDVLTNVGTVNGLVFTGGADDDVLSNTGTVVATLNFGGDDGVDTLQNAGSVANLVFTGGADDDVLVNQVGGTVTTLNFGGDDGVDALQNLGTVGSLTFGGGADDDVLINNGTVDGLVFTGGADDDTLTNTGTVVSTLNFGGDDGVDTLSNTGGVADLVFTGGADDDVLINSGSVTTLDFTGGADDDILVVDSGGTVGDINFGGDDGADTLQNSGVVTTLTFGGGADDDVLVNQPSGTVGTLTFGGDIGADALQNDGAVASLTFNGGADDDLLINNGSNVTTLTFNGGADDDILLNTGSDITTLTFNGGADDDVLQNNGSNVDTLTFGGDTGLDVLINNGDAVNSLVFTGGADDDVLFNNGNQIGSINFGGDIGDDTLIVRGSGTGAADSRIVFTGGAGFDAFQNDAQGFASIIFHGDDGADVLKNNASEISSLTFNGGADDDVLENNGDAVSTLVFNGDDGADILINDGSAVTSITFTGGADDDLLVNNGAGSTGLVFEGGADDDTLVNNGSGVSNITFNGGADDDVLINTGAGVTDLVFGGDLGNDRFWNQKSAVQTGRVTFNGDDGADVLINDAGGVFDLTFNGGADDDGLQNNGANISGLTFNGGADDDVLINTGAGVADLVFNGDLGNDSMRQSGLNAGSVDFQGDDGDDLLINTGSVQTLTFGGGADDDVLQNDGVSVGTLNFGGDDGADLLVNNGTVDSLTFSGGADDDTLQNNATVATLVFQGGADDDVLINNGDGIATLVFNGDDGADTLINNGDDLAALTFTGGADGDTLRTHGTGIGTIEFDGGTGADAFHYNSTGAAGNSVTFLAGAGNDFFAWRGAADSLTFDGGTGDDLAMILGSGNLSLGGGDGDDTFQFQSHPDAWVTVTETWSGASDTSSDTLDFSSYSGGPLNIDLRVTTPQQQSTRFTIELTDGLGVENIIGTSFGDTILGNARNNLLSGADYSDGFVGPVAAPRGVTQWVLLDFDSHTDPGEHVYTQAERDEISSRVEAVYRGPNAGAPWFDVRVTQTATDIPSGMDYATITFNQTPASGRPGGLASEVDPGNVDPGGSAAVQINGLLGGLITQEDVSSDTGGGSPEKNTGTIVGDDEIGADKPAATSENFVLLSAKIAAHELAHLVGLRHTDSFGPIGYGLHDPPGGAGYKPVYTGPVGGVETFDHLLGSPASVGSTRFNDLNELFFGEREAVKLAYANSDPADTTTAESAAAHQTAAAAQSLQLVSLAVPNTLSKGLNDTKEFFVQLQAVVGRIDVSSTTSTSQSDWYSFTGEAGELVNIDVLSNSVARFGTQADDYVDTIARVWYDVGGTMTLVPYYGGVAENDDIFEPTDSSIIDLILPSDGTYYIEIDTFSRGSADAGYADAVAFRDALVARRDDTDPNNDLTPAEDQLLQRLNDTLSDTDVGNYHLTVFRFDKASATDGIDTIKGNGGSDAVDGGPGDSYELLVDLGATGTSNEGTAFTRTIVIDDRAASDWTGSTVDYGDGGGIQSLTVDGSGTFDLDHTYVDDGSFTITVTIVDDIGQTLTQTVEVTVDNVAPTPAIDSISSTRIEGTSIDFVGSATDPGGTNDTLTYNWNFGDGSALATGASVAHTYADDGTYTATLTVSDEDGGTTLTTQSITVDNVAPTPTVVSISSIRVEATSIDFIGSATDPAGTNDTLTYVWDFGDGSATETGTSVSHTYADDGTFTVTLTVSDEDGGSSSTTESITVANVAPTPAIDSVSSLRLEGTSIDFAGSATDPAGTNDTLTYVWDFGDGTATATGTDTTHTYADNGTYTVTLTVSDEDGGSTPTTQAITVDNVAPTVTVDSTLVEVDPTNIGKNSGTYADPGADTVAVTASVGTVQLDNGIWNWTYDASDVQEETLILTITATDSDDASSTVTFILIVNLPPALEVEARSTGVRGQTLDFTLITTDPNAADQARDFTYAINWGDGTPAETIVGSATLTVGHIYDTITADGATYDVSVTVTDARGKSSPEMSHSVAILRWEVQDDPLHPGETVLMIGGSTGSDFIKVKEAPHSDFVRLKINEWENDIRIKANAGNMIDRLAIYGQAGNDIIHVSLNVDLPALIDGGVGDDFLVAGRGSTLLLGQDGNDTLFGSYKRGILIGGLGSDRIFGWNGSDLLIGGTTSFDNNRAALDALMSEWTSNRTYDERRENMMGVGTGDRSNGNYFLKFNQSDATLNTVFDDDAQDLMWGGKDIDWYLANTDGDDDSKKDKLFGAKWYEVVDDLDR